MTDADAAWQPMIPTDLPAIERVGEQVHPGYPEAPAILAERQTLFPQGCFVLIRQRTLQGYAVAHPWRFGQPPALNTRLHRIPDDPDTFYLHDIALLPQARGQGLGDAIVQHLLTQGHRFGPASLIAVANSHPFWHRHGFIVANSPAIHATLATYGPEAAFMTRLLDATNPPP